MELNRSGKWADAAAVALSKVENEETPLQQKCEAYYSLVYAEIRLNRLEAARAHVGLFDRTCSELNIPWLEAEVSRLRDELEPQPKAAMKQSKDGWVVAPDPASFGLSRDAVAAHASLCKDSGADACVLVYRGKIVQEWYGPRYREPAYAMSATKSVSGLLVGMLVADKKLTVDDKVSHYIPQWRAGAESGVTVHQLLTMTSGLRRLHDDGVGGVEDKESFVFALPLSHEPGTHWEYTNEGVFLLSPLMDVAAGEPIEDYAQRRLFDPLGLAQTRLHVYPKGQAWTHADMETTARDLARIGLLVLNRGRWGDEQFVAESWIASSITPSQDLRRDYGLLWWLYRDPRGFAALGRFDTNLYVFPDLELVAVRMQSGPVVDAKPYEPSALTLFKQLRSE
jgi:CubicO group peptidase (beta-lactamase class C family)